MSVGAWSLARSFGGSSSVFMPRCHVSTRGETDADVVSDGGAAGQAGEEKLSLVFEKP